MQPGDIFHIDSDAILDMENEEFSVVWRDKAKNEHRLAVGTQFRVAKTLAKDLPVEVRASKIDPTTGKCSRGRPRRFPAAVVYRLLGETAPDPSTLVAPTPTTPVATQVAPSDVVKVLLDEPIAAEPEPEFHQHPQTGG